MEIKQNMLGSVDDFCKDMQQHKDWVLSAVCVSLSNPKRNDDGYHAASIKALLDRSANKSIDEKIDVVNAIIERSIYKNYSPLELNVLAAQLIGRLYTPIKK